MICSSEHFYGLVEQIWRSMSAPFVSQPEVDSTGIFATQKKFEEQAVAFSVRETSRQPSIPDTSDRRNEIPRSRARPQVESRHALLRDPGQEQVFRRLFI